MGRIVSPLYLQVFLEFFLFNYMYSGGPFLHHPSLMSHSQQSLNLFETCLVKHALNLFSLSKKPLLTVL